ncbi:MAG: hypothetical protein HC933_05290 [Pleurocapsa sp. SU_196_0]|nr:hypothetical protein [Pleurocapsa sp. SU_196_0]
MTSAKCCTQSKPSRHKRSFTRVPLELEALTRYTAPGCQNARGESSSLTEVV